MLTVEEALARCLEATLDVLPEEVALADALGRVLASDIHSPLSLPQWDNSAMDGYAVRAADTGWHDGHDRSDHDCDAPDPGGAGVTLRVIETIAAGAVAGHSIEPGTAARIMTGAPLPAGADAVVMREHTDELCDRVMVRGVARPGQHIRRAGEEVRPGDVLLRAGRSLTGPALGLVASLGLTTVSVARRPRVGVLTTGDEIVPPGQPLGPGQIYSSNAAALLGLVAQAGAIGVDCGNAPDTLEGTRAAFRRAMECDIIVSTGGVSVGDFDVVKQAMAEEGADMRFWKVCMKPGKPLAFGVIGGRPAFGLPGNPVSCMVNFLQFVRPVLRRSMGDTRPFLPVVLAHLSGSIKKQHGRNELFRVKLRVGPQGLVATSVGEQGSARVTSMVEAHGFVLLGADSRGAAEGARVAVQVFDDSFLSSSEPGYRWKL